MTSVAFGGAGVKPGRVMTLLKSLETADPVSIGAIELGPDRVYIGEVR